MKKLAKKALLSTLVFSIIGSTSGAFAFNYTVETNDTYWKISQKYNVSMNSLLKVNNATESSVLYTGQSIIVPDGENFFYYEVKTGDTAWLLSQKFKFSLKDFLTMNNLSDTAVLNINQKVKIPIFELSTSTTNTSTSTTPSTPSTTTSTTSNQNYTYYEVKSGDTAWTISQKFGMSLNDFLTLNNLNSSSVLNLGQKVKVVSNVTSSTTSSTTSNTTSTPTTTSTSNTNTTSTVVIPAQPKITITYLNYTVKSGDNYWNISEKHGIPMQELLNANNTTADKFLQVGQVIKVPQRNIPVMQTLGDKYGEYLDWWTGAQYLIPIGAKFKVVDFNTGKYFMAQRTYGANHADCEPLTTADTAKMKEIWGGQLSWVTRPAIIEYNGRQIAASVASMGHAGNDAAPAGVNTTWRSGDYGPGPNFDAVKGNGMDGHFDIHFLNSTTHNTGLITESHQKNIKTSAGIIK